MKTIRIYESTYDLGAAKKNHMSSIVKRAFDAENNAETFECNSVKLNKKKGISLVEDVVTNGAGSKGHFFISEEC